MTNKEFMMRLHGDFLHRATIYFLKDILSYKESVEFRDERQFKKLYHSPCEPDIYFTCIGKRHSGNKIIKEKELRVVEVETNPTKESVRKKQQQYEEALTGVKLTVIDVSEYESLYDGTFCCDLVGYRSWLESRLPI